MTIRHDVPEGAPTWIDLMSTDVDASKAFYGELFGWTAESGGAEFGGYINFSLGDEQVAGLMACREETGPMNVWSVYLKTDDAEATAKAATDHGGEVFVPAMALPHDIGSMAVVVDPGGAAVGAWQPGTHRGGVVATTGAPCHFELHTKKYDEALEFYKAVFGWEPEAVSDTPALRYSVQNVGDGENAGIMDAAQFADDPLSGWGVYFAVDDTDAALDKIGALGGRTVTPPEDSPYGRIAVAADSNGAMFKLRAAS